MGPHKGAFQQLPLRGIKPFFRRRKKNRNIKRKDIQRGPLGDHLKDDLASGDKVSEADKELKESFSYQGEPRWRTSGWPASKYTPNKQFGFKGSTLELFGY